jgi:hypothetical protein
VRAASLQVHPFEPNRSCHLKLECQGGLDLSSNSSDKEFVETFFGIGFGLKMF